MDSVDSVEVGYQNRSMDQRYCKGNTFRRVWGKPDRWGCRDTINPYRHQFTIHKLVRSREFVSKDEIKAIDKAFANYVDDGGLEAVQQINDTARDSSWNAWNGIGNSNHIPYSLNKRKRWLLAEELQRNICAVDGLDNVDFKTVLVERELITASRRLERPDCIRVCESHVECPEVLPNQKYALASQLRLKAKGLIAVPRKKTWWQLNFWERHHHHEIDYLEEEEQREEPVSTELYYEICYPRPTENSNLRPDSHFIKEKRYGKNKKKSASKRKSQKVGDYQYWHGLCDSHTFKQDIQERSWEEEEVEECNCACMVDRVVEEEDVRSSPSLGMVVAHLMKKSQKETKRKRRRCKKSILDDDLTSDYVNTNRASSSPAKMFGKNTMVYEEKSDDDGDDDDDDNNALEESAPVDVRVLPIAPTPEELETKFTTDLRLAMNTVLPNHLRNVFGSVYMESMSQPRRFAVDISQRVPAAIGSKMYALFELHNDNNMNSLCNVRDFHQIQDLEGFVNARVTLIINPNVVRICESDLSDALHSGKGYLVHTVSYVVQYLANFLTGRLTVKDTGASKSIKKSTKYAVSMETVTMANGWQLRVDSPDDVFREIEAESQDTNTFECLPSHFTNKFVHFCGICYETLQPGSDEGVEAIALNACEHWFCAECWRQHLGSRVKQGDFNIICPAYDCKSAVDIVTKMSLMSTSDFFRHLDHVKDAAIRRRTEWQWCPNPRCGRMASVMAGTGSVAVDCECGWVWCLSCLQEAHWPATCQQAAKYRKLVQNIVPKMKNRAPPIAYVEVKRCPQCKYPIEKNGGCPHMSCRMCGTSFCWLCLGDWNAHSWAGMNIKCPKPKKTTETVWLNDESKGATLSEMALHHRELRCRSVMKRYKENAYKQMAREFLKESYPSNPKLPSLHSSIEDDIKEYLPVTWVYTQHTLAALLGRTLQTQECLAFCFEAHFVLEFMAVYINDKSVAKKHRKPFTPLTDRLEFITGRLDELLGAKSNFGQARLLMQAGKTCIKQLARQMKRVENEQES